MHVEQTDLADDGRADEVSLRRAGDLRANFQAAAAGNAGGKFVGFFLSAGRHARTFAEIVSAVDRDPGFYALQAFKHELPVDCEIADHWKFGERLDANGLFEFIDQRRTGHARFSVDEHGAGAADFFQAIRIVGNWGGFFSFAGDRIFGDVPQADDDVHGGTPVEREFFPVGRALRADLPLNFYDDLFLFSHESSAKFVAPSLCNVTSLRRICADAE